MPVMWYSILVGVAVKATVVLCLAWFAATLLRRRSASARHLVWTTAVVAVVALPLFTAGLPALQFSAASRLLPPSSFFVASSTSFPARESAHPGAAAKPQPTGSIQALSGRLDWRFWLVLLWAAGAVVAFARLLAACSAIRSIRRAARSFPDSDLAGILSYTLGIRRPVEVLEAPSANMPMTFGILRPYILMPASATEWTAERRRVVLLHELAHVRRDDVATHLLARTALCLYWWNPLAWIAWRGFVEERERAADDLVLTAGARASEYAGHLLGIASSVQSSRALECAAVAMVRRSQLEQRLRAILDAGVNRNTPGRAWAVIVLLLVLGLVAPLAAIRAQESQQTQAQDQPVNLDADAVIRSATTQRDPGMLEKAAKNAQDTRSYDLALKFLQAATLLRAEVSGQESAPYGLALLNLAELEQRRHLKSAEASYVKAAQVLGERPEAAPAYIHLGTVALSKENFPEAIEDFQHARRLDSTSAGLATMWMAVVRQREINTDEASALYLSALSQQDPKSAEASTTRRLYGQFLRDQGRADEASEIEKANAVKTRPPSGPANRVYRVGSPGVTPPSLQQKVEPEYSDQARAAKLTGTELLYVEIGPDGRAHNPSVMQGLGLGLDENGIDAVSAWRFQPGAKDGQPATIGATIEINWRLQ